MMQEILTIKQVADYLQLNEKTIYRMIANKRIPCFKIGGSWRFKKSVLEKWLDSLSVFLPWKTKRKPDVSLKNGRHKNK
ncbi:helix-turn-helix domain-containing protein [bacterium]|nr:helix-turn-helix domain-containing protein [bacterium]MBU3955298.1 helix-turn-helix domain-containing protein [bacterium]